jgi:hypothetical protein
MGLFDRLKTEAVNARNAARGAIDEGRVRIEIFRVRQQADAAAQALGYAVHRARRDGRELDAATLERLEGTLAAREADATRLETELARHRGDTARTPGGSSAAAASAGDAGTSGRSETAEPSGPAPSMDEAPKA